MFLNPLLFLAAMGLGLGGLIDETSGDVGGVSYLEFVAPGLMVASAVQLVGRRVAVAGRRGREVAALLPRHRRDADPARADVFGGFVLWNAIRTHVRRDGVPRRRRASLGAIPSRVGRARDPGAALTAAAFCAPLAAFSVDAGDRLRVPGDHAARHPAAVPVLGHVLPDLRAARLARAARVALAAVARRRARAARDDRRPSTFWPIARARRACSLAFVVAGGYVGTRTFTRRLTA